jgi:alpha-D-xyloside xylohydrolase
MKFSDGYWLAREGFDVRHPRQARDARASEFELSVLAPTRTIITRGDTLNTPAATITLSAAAEGVIRVRIEHHAGTRDPGPEFALPGATEFRPIIAADATGATLVGRAHRPHPPGRAVAGWTSRPTDAP